MPYVKSELSRVLAELSGEVIWVTASGAFNLQVILIEAIQREKMMVWNLFLHGKGCRTHFVLILLNDFYNWSSWLGL